MHVTESPQALPGCCFICGSSNRDWYIDTGKSLDFHGAVYFCDICFADMAKLVHYLSLLEYEDEILKKEALETEVYELTAKVQGLEKALDDLLNSGYRAISWLNRPGANTSTVQSSEVAEQSVPSGTGEVGSGEGETPESSDDEGVAELSDDAPSSSDFSIKL